MRIKEEWAKIADRKMAGDHVVIRQGRLGSEVTNMLQFNDTGIFLWREMQGRDFELSDIADLIVETYAIDRATAEHDAGLWLDKLRGFNLIDE